VDSTGGVVQRLRYMAWGEARYEEGAGLTDNRYTGQREEGYGLYFYQARWYDPALGRFAQADSIIPQPGDPREWDRYGYVRNNPSTKNDPSGHCAITTSMISGSIIGYIGSCIQDIFDTYDAYLAGETRPTVLYMEATGLKDLLVSAANSVHQMNNDVSTVFSDAPLKDRIIPSIRVGTFAVGMAAIVVGGAQLVKAGIETLSIKTPYGRAWQSLSPEALSLRRQVSNGMEIYRGGALGKTNVAEGQFWAPENPLNPGYSSRYGAGSYSGLPDFVIGGNLKAGTPLITRAAPGVGANAGGALEIVTQANGVHINYFYMR